MRRINDSKLLGYENEKWTEFEKRRNENLKKNLDCLKAEIFEKVDSSMNKRMNHLTPSPETQLKLQHLEEQNKIQNEKIDLMACQVHEMYLVFTSTNFLLKFTIKLFGAIGVIAGAIIGICELIKRNRG